MNPLLVESEGDRTVKIRWATDLFRQECRAIEACQGLTSYTPRFYGSAELRQDMIHEYPGGYLHVLAMSRVGGSPVPEIEDLTDAERSLIKNAACGNS